MRCIALCIATYLRPGSLTRLLEAIDRLDLPDDVRLSIFVVDNDSDRSAEAASERYRAGGRFPIHYDVEPRPGIPAVRNRLVSNARATGADVIGFIDDDEVPRPDWAHRLLAAMDRSEADVAIGPSSPIFESEPPQWAVDGRFYDRTAYPVQEPMPLAYARTSGVLIQAETFDDVSEGPFDVALGLCGGSDRVFFTQLEQAGRRFVWVPEAIVDEHVPASRVTRRWLLTRSYRTGITFAISKKTTGVGRLYRAARAAKSLLSCVRASAATVLLAGRNPVRQLEAARRAAFNLGVVAGSLGFRYREYLTIHGAASAGAISRRRAARVVQGRFR